MQKDDVYWAEQLCQKCSGETLDPADQEQLEVWLGVKHCLHTVISDCLAWAQQRNREWERLQNPSQAEQLIAAQRDFLAKEGIEPITFNPDSERSLDDREFLGDRR